SESGAAVKGDVRNFPVAIALHAGNFDFEQAKEDGSDLRFTGARDGGPLAHSIEHWDRARSSALVWVKVPIVRGGSATQGIFMRWGPPAATSIADSAAVFDVRDGFVGAWHLDEDGSVVEGGYKDATGNAAHGTGVNLRPGSRVDSRIGKGTSLRHA